MAAHPTRVRVWDRFVRVFHWPLVASFATAYFVTEHIGLVHKGAGYLALALVAARCVWGFIAPGPRHPQGRRFIFVQHPHHGVFVLRQFGGFRFHIALTRCRGHLKENLVMVGQRGSHF